MGVRILTFLPVSLHKCPLNPSVCVGGIIPQTPGCTDISYDDADSAPTAFKIRVKMLRFSGQGQG